MSKKQPTHKRYTFWPFIIAAVAVLCLPAVLNHSALFGIKAFDFSGSGQIGDTIGGITAPFFNLIAAILIFLSFREQTKANEYLIRSAKIEKEYDIIFHIIENLESRIRSFEYRLTNNDKGQKTTNIFSGIAGIQFYTNDLHMDNASMAKQNVRYLDGHSQDAPYTLNCYSDIYQIVRLIYFIANKINTSDFRINDAKKDETKISLIERLDITYSTS